MEVQPRLLEDDEPWPACRCRLQDLGQQLLVPNQAFSVWTLTSPCLCVGFQGPVKATVGFWFLVGLRTEDVSQVFDDDDDDSACGQGRSSVAGGTMENRHLQKGLQRVTAHVLFMTATALMPMPACQNLACYLTAEIWNLS